MTRLDSAKHYPKGTVLNSLGHTTSLTAVTGSYINEDGLMVLLLLFDMVSNIGAGLLVATPAVPDGLNPLDGATEVSLLYQRWRTFPRKAKLGSTVLPRGDCCTSSMVHDNSPHSHRHSSYKSAIFAQSIKQ